MIAIISKNTKAWFERINGSKNMLWLLGTLSFLETIILPIPLELILIPLMAANRQRIWLLATITTAGCLIASLVGYGVGMLLFQSIGNWFIEFMGMQESYQAFQTFFNQYGFAAILVIGIVPIPFQVAMITAGLSGYPILLFVLAAFIARGLRYYGLAWLVYRFGHSVLVLWKRHALLTSLVGGVIVLLFVLGLQALASLVM
ncbi:YqaA family protein [Halomonas sp.]|uniref:YqaA family protein n=1 Tax=Halomonas sp. TaxID=1486246 RepID=UPI003A93BD98